MSAPPECAASAVPSQARLTVMVVPAASTASIRSESTSRTSPTLIVPALIPVMATSALDAVSAELFCPVSSIDRPVTSIRSESTLMIDPTPSGEESVTSTSVSVLSSASASAPAGASSALNPYSPVIAIARWWVPVAGANAEAEDRSISMRVNGGPELAGSRK